MEEDAVEVVVVVLPRVGKDGVEVPAALLDHLAQADDLRARADDDQQFKAPVVFESHVVSHG